MKIRSQKIAWTAVAGILALLAGVPVWADDTELLLVSPALTAKPKPNVMFILDTSGSMGTEEETTEPYDSTQDYSGDCDRDSLYWTNVDVLPVCDGNETQIILKSAFQCNFAQRQIDGIGSYTNTMVQWRTTQIALGGGIVQNVYWWQDLIPGDETSFVECQADRALHGDGTTGEVYATAYGSINTIGDPWVIDPNSELSWGSAPRNIEYTVFDGNYLNWKASPNTVDLSRMEIVREVTKTVLNSINNVNVGIMRFNDSNGGPVIQAVVDLDTNRSDIIDKIDSLVDGGATPLSEALYESALYWNGLEAEFGESVNEHVTDPAALASDNPEVYKSPTLDACAKNFNVLLTDGVPVNDEEAHALVPTLPDFSTLMGGATACSGSAQGDCLDDIGEYLSLKDTDPNNPGVQSVVTHTIGFAIDLPILENTADDSGGNYFLADDVESLTLALLQIVADITERSLSFSAPAVSVNTFNRTQNLNDLYLTMFGAKPSVHWPGNLKKYKITNRVITDANDLSAVDPNTGFFFNSAQSFWTTTGPDGNDVLRGGAASLFPDPTVRSLFTNNGSDNVLSDGTNAITPSNASAFQLSDFGLSGATGEPTMDEMIRWMRGEDVRDEDQDPGTTVRNSMGDPLHSQPAAIVYGGTQTDPDVIIYTATNDGYLHAVDGRTGTEIWSFVPKELLANMTRLFFDPSANFKNYGLDGNIVPVVFDENNNGIVDGANDFVRIIVGMRRGGSSYYALDVTNRDDPELLWAVSPAEMGQSWSTPVIARIDAPGINDKKAAVIFGAGYDNSHDTFTHPVVNDANGAAIIMLDLESGAELWRASRSASGTNDRNLPTMTRSIPGQIRVIDISGDGLADRMYASDMGGQILRFDIFNGQTGADFVTGGVIAQLGAEGLGSPTLPDTRRFYTSPDISIFTSDRLERRFLSISIGSGYRAHPLANNNADRFYSVRDKNVFNQLSQDDYNNLTVVTDASLVEVGGQSQVELDIADTGWKFTLPNTQKVLSDSITFNDEIFFVAFSPENNTTNTCSVGAGTNFLYRVSVFNGDPIVNNLDDLADDDADDARRQTLAQGGIAPTPTVLFPSPDDPDNCHGDECKPPPLMCVGVECPPMDLDIPPVRTLWTQDGIM